MEIEAPPKTTLDKITKGMSVAGELTREGILDFVEGKFRKKDYQDIIEGKSLTGREFLQRFYNNKNYDPSFITSLTTEIGTDPITYLGGPLFKGATKGLEILGAGAKVAKYAPRAAAGASIMALGGGDKKDIATGAAIGLLAGKGLNIIGNKIGKAGSNLIDKYYKKTRKNLFELADTLAEKYGLKKLSTSEAVDFLRKAGTNLKLNTYYQKALLGKQTILKDMLSNTKLAEDEVRKLYTSKIAQGASETIAMREKELNKLIAPIYKSEVEEAIKKSGKQLLKKDKQKIFNSIKKRIQKEHLSRLTTRANSIVGNKILKEVDAIKDPALSKAIREYIEHNRSLIKEYNKVHGTSQIPIDFHTADILKDSTDDFTKKLQDVTEGFVKRSKQNFETQGLTAEQIDELSSQRYANAFLTKQEKLAEKILQIPEEQTANIIGKPALSKAARRIEGMLGVYDSFTNKFMKPMHLLFTHTWLMNNYTDNVLKAWIQNGELSALKTAGHSMPFNNLMGKKGSKLYKEMLEIFNPKRGHMKVKFDNEILGLANDTGVVSNTFYQDINNTAKESLPLLIAKHGRKKADKIMGELTARGWHEKGLDAFTNILRDKIGTHGAAVEGVARVKSFEHILEALLSKNKGLKNIVKKTGYRNAYKDINEFRTIVNKAKKITDDTFFNYDNVNLFEQKVMKRIAPYYTFFSRNLNYHLNNIFENTSGISKALKIRRNLGDTPTDKQRKEMPEWLLKYDPKILSEDEKGNLRTIYFPNFSPQEAFDILSFSKESLNKIHPVIKSAIQWFANKDIFLDNTLTVEGYRKNRKPVFNNALIPALLGANVKQNPNKTLYTDDSRTAENLMLKSNLLPTPLLDTIASAAYDLTTGRKSVEEVLTRQTPLKIKTISQGSRKYKRMEKLYDKRNKMIDKKEARREEIKRKRWEEKHK